MEYHHIHQPEGVLRVTTAGSDGPPVLLLSGAGVDNASLSWARLIPVLAAAGHRVIAPDWPKQGGSQPWNGLADHSRLLRVITTVLDHFGIERADVVGMSQGGAMTLAYGIEHPERVRRLVPMAPGGIISFPPVVHQLLWLTAKSRLIGTTLPRLMFRSRAMCVWFARTSLFAGPVDDFDEIVDEFHAEVLAGGGGSSDWQNTSIGFRRMNVDLRPRLHTITAPTLFIQGDKDRGVAYRHTRAAAELVPGARFELLEGAGHWVNRQMPERVNTLVADFLAEP